MNRLRKGDIVLVTGDSYSGHDIGTIGKIATSPPWWYTGHECVHVEAKFFT